MNPVTRQAGIYILRNISSLLVVKSGDVAPLRGGAGIRDALGERGWESCDEPKKTARPLGIAFSSCSIARHVLCTTGGGQECRCDGSKRFCVPDVSTDWSEGRPIPVSQAPLLRTFADVAGQSMQPSPTRLCLQRAQLLSQTTNWLFLTSSSPSLSNDSYPSKPDGHSTGSSWLSSSSP